MPFLQILDLSEIPSHEKADSSPRHENVSVVQEYAAHEEITQALSKVSIELHALELNANAPETFPDNVDLERWLTLYDQLEPLLVHYSMGQLFVIPCHAPSQRNTGLEEQCYNAKTVHMVLQGEVLYAIRINQTVYEYFCQPGDCLIIPPSTPFWMDLGAAPDATLLRGLPEGIPPRAERTGKPFPLYGSRLSD